MGPTREQLQVAALQGLDGEFQKIKDVQARTTPIDLANQLLEMTGTIVLNTHSADQAEKVIHDAVSIIEEATGMNLNPPQELYRPIPKLEYIRYILRLRQLYLNATQNHERSIELTPLAGDATIADILNIGLAKIGTEPVRPIKRTANEILPNLPEAAERFGFTHPVETYTFTLDQVSKGFSNLTGYNLK